MGLRFKNKFPNVQPMKKTTTPSVRSVKKTIPSGPSNSTLMLLRSVARTYSAKPVIPYSAAHYALN